MSALDFLVAHTPNPTAPVTPALSHARAALDAAGRELLAVPDESLERDWQWQAHGADVRYGLFRAIEAVETATAECEAVLEATAAKRSRAALRIASATVARWDLHGRLAALDDAVLDRVAKAGEWTVRETLAHIVGGQRGYASYTAWHWTRNSTEPPTASASRA